MAEGLCRDRRGDDIEPFSAGIEKHGLNPMAVRVMDEIGIDISGQSSKTIGELPDIPFDLVVTVCADADASCPAFPRPVPVMHRGFDDPPRLAAAAKSEEEALGHYRRVRDEIERFIIEDL
jgi:arsenate reductase